MFHLPQSVKGKMILWCLDPVWSPGCQFQNTHAGFTILSVHSQHLKSSSRPALSNLWLLLVCPTLLVQALDNIDLNLVSHRYVSGVLKDD